MNYKIIGKNNQEYGPYPIEKLQSFADMGKLRPKMCLIDSQGNKFFAKDIILSLSNIEENMVQNNLQNTVDLTYLADENSNTLINDFSNNNSIDLTNDILNNNEENRRETIRYTMIGGDGKVYGPYTTEELQRYVYENRILPNSLLTSSNGQSLNAREILTFPNSLQSNYSSGINDSGMGNRSVLPYELRGLNWGAFFFPLFWGISHNTWIALVSLIPSFGWIMALILLFKGNEWAWQNRRWQSVTEFRETQNIWKNVALIFIGISVFLGFLLLLL